MIDFHTHILPGIDDGSRDDTYRILKELEADMPKLTALTKENGGHSIGIYHTESLTLLISTLQSPYLLCLSVLISLSNDANFCFGVLCVCHTFF